MDVRINNSYQFEGGQVSSTTSTVTAADPRGIGFRQTVVMTCEGDIFGEDAAELTTKKAQFLSALNVAQEIALYDNLGARTGSVITSAGSDMLQLLITDVDFPKADGGQWVNQLNFRFKASVVYPKAGIPNGFLMNFREEITKIGNGKGRIVAQEGIQGRPDMVLLSEFTKYRTIQEGEATGYRDYPRIPGPIWPGYLQNPESAVKVASGRGIGATEFTIVWRYEFESNLPLIGAPHVWT